MQMSTIKCVQIFYYLCGMKAIEFLKEYEACLSLRGIETELDIPIGTLRRSIRDGKLPEKHEEKIVSRFSFLTRGTVEKTVEKSEGESAKGKASKPVVVKQEVKKPVAKIAKIGDKESLTVPDLNKNGSFDMSKWEDCFRYMEHTSGLRCKYRKDVGKGLFYPNGLYE